VSLFLASSVARRYKSKGFETLPKFTGINAGVSLLILSENALKLASMDL
jgi:hypothetical protein